MKKQFELPKEFLEGWLNALRNKTYNQIKCTLYRDKPNEGYCCLGVACKVLGASDSEIEGFDVPIEVISKEKLPKLFHESKINTAPEEVNSFVDILVNFNDGVSHKKEYWDELLIVYPNLQLPDLEVLNTRAYTFEEIADFIEANVEGV